jgi:antitoxin component YwqK of YwqJK toxin-antitoxin module
LSYAFIPAGDDGLYEQYFKKQLITKGELKNGLKNGSWEFYYPNQNLHFTGDFINDSKTGEWTFYDEKGNPKTKTVFNRNQVTDYKLYFDNGHAVAREFYTNGEFNGTTEFFYETGETAAIIQKHQNRTEFKSFHKSGQLKFLTVDWKSKKNDTTKVYHSNGQLKEELSFYKNILLAVGKSFDLNGEELNHGNFQDGKGNVIRYYDDGTVKSKASYNSGKKHGIAQFYFQNGQLSATGMFANGAKIGIWKYYDEEGNQLENKEYRGNVEDNEFRIEFSPIGYAIDKVSTSALFPDGDRGFKRYIKDHFENNSLLKNENVIFILDLDELGFVKNASVRCDRLSSEVCTEIEKSLTDLPRCIPAFEEGLPVTSSITQPFKF